MTEADALSLLRQIDYRALSNQADLLDKKELETYLLQHIHRFLLTIDLVKNYCPTKSAPHVLDIGSFPYFLPILLMKELQATVVGVDLPKEAYWPGQPYTPSQETVKLAVDTQDYTLTHHLINIERDPLPYRKTFDVALFTEVLEHLILQPHAVIEQIHSSLKPGGVMILSTPNARYLMKFLAALKGSNINEKYNLTLGAYGRHNREYVLEEVVGLLEAHNFTIREARLVNFRKPHLSKRGQLKYQIADGATALPGLRHRQEGIVVVAEKTGPTVRQEPEAIFRR